MSCQIKQVAQEGNFNEVGNIIKNKDLLLEQILRFEKITKLSQEEKQQQEEIKEKIKKSEKENIELMQEVQNLIRKEIQKVKQGKKVAKAYMQKPPENYSTIDISE